MPLQAILEAAEFDALPDVTVLGKDSFVKNEKENKFFLNLPADEAGKLAFNLQSSVAKLEANNKELLKQKGEANRESETFKSLGKTPDELKELLNSKRPEDLQKLIEKHNADMEAVKASFTESDNQKTEIVQKLQQQLADTNTKAAISRLRNEFDLNDMADFVLRDFIRSEPKDEGSTEYVTRVYENGNPALHAGEPMTPDQLIKGFQDGKKFLQMFNAGNGGGTGASNRQGSTGNGTNVSVSRAAVKEDVNLFRAAEEQAAKTGGQVVFTD